MIRELACMPRGFSRTDALIDECLSKSSARVSCGKYSTTGQLGLRRSSHKSSEVFNYLPLLVKKTYQAFRLVALLFIVSLTSAAHVVADEPLVFHSPMKEDSAFSDVIKQLQNASSVRSSFTQERHVRSLKRPLKSSGKFLYDRGRGVAWVQDTPFKIAYIVNAHGLRRQSMTEDLTSESVQSNPIVERISRTLLSVWSGDAAELKKYFDVYIIGTVDNWTIGLKPLSSEISQIISSIVLSGDKVVRSLSILDPLGDRSEFNLTDIEIAPKFSQDEGKLLS